MKTGKTRAKILETASDLFYKQGYMLTSISQILKESRVAKITFYEHFHTKEDLFVEYLTNMSDQMDEWLKAEVNKYMLPRDQVIALFDFLTQLSARASYSGCNFLNVLSDFPPDSGRVKQIIKRQKDNVRGLFVEILRPIKKDRLADELYMLFDGLNYN